MPTRNGPERFGHLGKRIRGGRGRQGSLAVARASQARRSAGLRPAFRSRLEVCATTDHRALFLSAPDLPLHRGSLRAFTPQHVASPSMPLRPHPQTYATSRGLITLLGERKTMNAETLFSALQPAPWARVESIPPLERARYFVVPREESREAAVQVHSLVLEVVAGRATPAGVRWKYSGSDEAKADRFNMACDFYHSLAHGARDILQAENSDIQSMWPTLEFDCYEKCHNTCRSLKKKRLLRKNRAVRTFYPPWHFGCMMHVSDSEQNPSKDFGLTIIPGSTAYFCNPYDLLVSQGLIADFAGIDFGANTSAIYDLSKVK